MPPVRRSSTRFKDYDKTPIGFGVALFCIAKQRTASGSGPGPGGAAGGPGQGLHPQLPTPPPPRPTAHGGAASTSVAGTGGGGAGGSGDTRVAVLEPAVLYQRFMDVFADWGEPNIPIDRGERGGGRWAGGMQRSRAGGWELDVAAAVPALAWPLVERELMSFHAPHVHPGGPACLWGSCSPGTRAWSGVTALTAVACCARALLSSLQPGPMAVGRPLGR